MRRKLASLAVLGAVLLAGCSITIGPSRIHSHNGSLVIIDNGPPVDMSGPAVERAIAWTGGSSINFSLPADITFAPAATASLVVSGPKGVVDRIRLDGDTVELGRGRYAFGEGVAPLKVSFFGPGIERVGVSRSARLTATGVRQERFTLDASSSSRASLTADVEELTLDVDSSADVETSGRAERAVLTVSSGGEAMVAADSLTDLKADVSSSGRLHAKGGVTALDVELSSGANADFTVDRAPSVRARVDSSASLVVAGKAERIDVEVSSGGEARLEADGASGRVKAGSSARVHIAGRIDTLDVEASSGGVADLAAAAVKNATVRAVSSSNVRVSPSQSLTADVSSGAKLRVESNPPQSNVRTSSSGNIEIAGARP